MSNKTLYFYDHNGNQTSKVSEVVAGGAGTESIQIAAGVVGGEVCRYNGFNQLVETGINGGTIKYAYDPSGLRVSKDVNGTETEYILDGPNVVAEFSSGAVTAEYIRGVNLLCSTIGATTRYYLYIAHGDVTQLADASGTVTKSYDYDAFGKEKNIDDNDTNPFRYCGEYFDLSSGTYYLRARYYDPTIGRFLSEDTYKGKATDPLSLNLYTYCENNPIVFIDPSGHVIELSSKATKEEIEQYERAIEYLKTSEIFAELYQMLIDSEEVFTIQFTTNHKTSFNFKTLIIKWDPTSGLVVTDGVQSPALQLAHEMGHAAQYLDGDWERGMFEWEIEDGTPGSPGNVPKWETPIAEELGEYTRNTYYMGASSWRMDTSTDWGVLKSNPNRSWWQFWEPKNVFVNQNTWKPK